MLDIGFKKVKYERYKTKALVIGCFEDFLDDIVKSIDSCLKRVIAKAIKEKSFSGKKNQLKIVTNPNNIYAEYLIVVGLGKKKNLDLEIIRQVSGTAARAVGRLKSKEFSTTLINHITNLYTLENITQAVCEGIHLSLYCFNEFKTENKDEIFIKKVTLLSNKSIDTKNIKKGIIAAKEISDAVNLSRDLVSLPGNFATPTYLSKIAKNLSGKYKIGCKILKEEQMKKIKMGAFLGVSKGSHEPAKFIILEYWGKNKKDKPFVFIGKGITFDSGGISLKPSKGMEEMKSDMAGGAAVIGVLKACSALALPVNLIGIIPATENMPGGSAAKPGDILKSMSGKTIEIISTDAEGRLVLADALTYAERYKPKVVIDIATLTGACIAALGKITTCVIGNDNEVISSIKKAGSTSGEKVWELPLWEEYSKSLNSQIADMKNSGVGGAGTITAAAFLQKFSSKFRWAHLDIAGTAWSNKNAPYAPKGATGVGVRILVQYIRDQI